MSTLSTSYLLPYPTGQPNAGYVGYYPSQTAYAPSYGTVGYRAVSGQTQRRNEVKG